ncbi:MAG: HAMP domain-containing protein [Acidobacteria bacterium]|nr:HAMP domain-containing protein [Acidobacteriota bacterium]
MGARLDARLSVIAPDGTVLSDSRLPGSLVGQLANHSTRPEIVQARQDGFGTSRRDSDTTGRRYLYVARRVTGNPQIGFVRGAIHVEDLHADERTLLGPTAALIVAAIVILALPAYLIVRRWAAPVESLLEAGRKLAAGQLESPISAAGDDEFGELGAALEKTRLALLDKIRQAERQYHFLDLVVRGMKEGLLLVGADRRVRLVNDAFLSVFRPQVNPIGRPLSEIVRSPQIIQVIETVLETGKDQRERLKQLVERGRAFEVIAYAVRTEDAEARVGAVALFLDVTRIEKLEQTRRDFVANVSHELRTPLTSIKASAITLVDGAAEDDVLRERFLNTIVRQADRMAALVSDLSDLSRIETGSIQLDMRDVDVSTLVPDVIHQVSPRYEEMGLHVSVDLPLPFSVRADRGRLEQILVNLVDNAMKFNRSGGTVTVRGRFGPEGDPCWRSRTAGSVSPTRTKSASSSASTASSTPVPASTAAPAWGFRSANT